MIVIEISTARLKSYVKILDKVSRTRNTKPVLGMVKLELENDILTFTSTNVESTIIITNILDEYSYDNISDNEIKSTEKSFSVLIPMKTLSELVNVISSSTVKIKEEKDLDPSAPYPVCVNGANAAPPEDVGSYPGYEHFLNVMKKQKGKEYKELSYWWGEKSFDSEKFSIDEVNDFIQDEESLQEYLEECRKQN